MVKSRCSSPVRRGALALCATGLLLISFAHSALATEPNHVTVRVEGLNETKLLPLTPKDYAWELLGCFYL